MQSEGAMDWTWTQHYSELYHQCSRNRHLRSSQRYDPESQPNGRWYSLPPGVLSYCRVHRLRGGQSGRCAQDQSHERKARLIFGSDGLPDKNFQIGPSCLLQRVPSQRQQDSILEHGDVCELGHHQEASVREMVPILMMDCCYNKLYTIALLQGSSSR